MGGVGNHSNTRKFTEYWTLLGGCGVPPNRDSRHSITPVRRGFIPAQQGLYQSYKRARAVCGARQITRIENYCRSVGRVWCPVQQTIVIMKCEYDGWSGFQEPVGYAPPYKLSYIKVRKHPLLRVREYSTNDRFLGVVSRCFEVKYVLPDWGGYTTLCD